MAGSNGLSGARGAVAVRSNRRRAGGQGSLALPAALERATRRWFGARAWSAVLAVWGAFIGVLPHVLHHTGPLAGAALLAGAGGTVLFAAIAIVVSIPSLLRIHRRFKTWLAPGIALALMAAAFSLSSFVIGPLITGSGESPSPQPGVVQPSGHAAHHSLRNAGR